MRKIKFRAKSKLDIKELDRLEIPHQDGWVYGNYADGFIIGNVMDAEEEYIAFEWWVAVYRNTLGQYTGQKDKTNKEIYEGDITVATTNGRLAIVRFGEYTDVIGNKRFGFYFEGLEHQFCFMPDTSNVLVWGNIHDNRELLKGGKINE